MRFAKKPPSDVGLEWASKCVLGALCGIVPLQIPDSAETKLAVAGEAAFKVRAPDRVEGRRR